VQLSERLPDTAGSDLRLELFVRSLAPETARPQQEAVFERLRGLADSEAVAATDVYVTGDCVCPSTVAAQTETGQFLLERYEAFESWTTANDAELVGFRNRCVDSSMTGETVTGIEFPRLCLAVYADETLLLVAPVVTGGGKTTIADVQDEIEQTVTADERDTNRDRFS
jgi:hypothetical protein